MESIKWPLHCKSCQFMWVQNRKSLAHCEYCLLTGKSLIKEYGRIGAQEIRNVCTHYMDAKIEVDTSKLAIVHDGRKPERRKTKFERYKDTVAQMYTDGKRIKDIAEATGLKSDTVSSYLVSLGLRKPPSETRRNRNEEYMSLYKQGLSDYRIAKELGVQSNNVAKWRRRRNLPKNEVVK